MHNLPLKEMALQQMSLLKENLKLPIKQLVMLQPQLMSSL